MTWQRKNPTEPKVGQYGTDELREILGDRLMEEAGAEYDREPWLITRQDSFYDGDCLFLYPDEWYVEDGVDQLVFHNEIELRKHYVEVG